MIREKVKLEYENLENFLAYGERNPDYLWIDKILNYTNLSKGYQEFETIIQRKSDQKFFKIAYIDLGQHGCEIDDNIAEEVFPEEKTITIYK